MDFQRVAEIQVVLEGISLPATRDELVEYALRQDGDAAAVLARLPDRRYERIDAVGEALRPTSPRRSEPELLPKPESGLPPGGADYVTAHPESGAVRPPDGPVTPPQDVIEEQTQAQQRQQQAQPN